METNDILKEILKKWGFACVGSKDDTAIAFRYQMNTFTAFFQKHDDFYYLGVDLCISGYFSSEDAENLSLGIYVCNSLNAKTYHYKYYIDTDNDLNISSETFIQDKERLEPLFKKSLNDIIKCKKMFFAKFKEKQEDANLLSELERE